MFELDKILELAPFSLDKPKKAKLFRGALSELTRHHYQNCEPYRKILDRFQFDPNAEYAREDFPFLPVQLFKDFDLLSVQKSDVIKTMTSSGTTGQSTSKIFLDRTTAAYQTKVLAKIVSQFIGPKRLPMLIVDTKAVIKDPKMFSARGAGILGFSMLGTDVTYALDHKMQLDLNALGNFCKKHSGSPILIFGFTSIIWEHFYQALARSSAHVDLSNAIVIHGGGWKKLADQAVDSQTFQARLKEIAGIESVHSYYGMVEQTGSIFMECEKGFLHSSIFSDVVIRRNDFSVCGPGEQGLIQVISLLPHSYPGHVLLTEDVGEIFGEDDCGCGRLGQYFKIYGRAQQAEVRGCSDTYFAS